MADSRFFSVAGPFTLADLARIAGAAVGEGADPAAEFHDVAPLETAGPRDVGFLDNKRYVEAFTQSRAGACLVHPSLAGRAPAGMALLVSDEPYRAYAAVAEAFYPAPIPSPMVAPGAAIDATATLGEGCRVDHGAVIGRRVEVGRRCRIGANSVIGDGVVIGDDCVIGANVTITHSLIGARVSILPGVRIGQDGFGFAMGPQGHRKVPQLGRVIIESDVEIGANTTIDRGAGPDTVIGAGSKIDNLVQIGHNVRLGKGCVVVAQVGISGSTHFGDFVVAAGQVGIAGHLTIGTGARISAQSGIMRDVAAGATVGGTPAFPITEHWRQVAALEQLAKKKGRS